MSDSRAALTMLHAQIVGAWQIMMTIRQQGLPDGVGNDSAMAIGEAAGILSRARALIGRDIDGLPPEPGP